MKDLTIILLTYNEEKNLPDCLNSLQDVNANLFCVDSFSTDNTLEILAKHNIKTIQHPFVNYADQRNWAQENNPYNTKWVFHLDAGERFTPQLSSWLNNEFDDQSDSPGFMFSRRTMIFGSWVKYGGHYPNFHLRLYPVDQGSCEKKVYDQHFITKGTPEVIGKGIDIIDTVMDNWDDFTKSHSRWAYFEAIEKLKSSVETGGIEPKLFGNPIQRRRWLKQNVFEKSPLFLRSFLYFFYRYVIRLGFLDGKTGLSFHLLQGFWFRFLIDACILELKIKMKKKGLSLHELVEKEYPHFIVIL